MKMQPIQSKFAVDIAHLIFKAVELGYQVTFGDAYRDPRATFPYSTPKSKHYDRLALDLNLFKDGVLLKDSADHEPLGIYWENLGNVWGGRWDDGNHYQGPDI